MIRQVPSQRAAMLYMRKFDHSSSGLTSVNQASKRGSDEVGRILLSAVAWVGATHARNPPSLNQLAWQLGPFTLLPEGCQSMGSTCGLGQKSSS